MKNPEQELAEIKSMMERSTRFLSLSGLSGVLAGIYALIGGGIAWYWLYFPQSKWAESSQVWNSSDLMPRLILLAVAILVLAVSTAWLLSKRKSKQKAQVFWNGASKRFMQALFIPVLVGGLFTFALIHEAAFQLIPANLLIFYGLGLVAASNFTLGEIQKLGFFQLILGIMAAFFPDYGLWFWVSGFGILHVVYGALMYQKYDR
jgi:MFS family permease